MSDWITCSLGDFVYFQRGHDLPKTQMEVGEVPVAGSNGVIGYHDVATTKGPGITIGRSGNIGTPKFYKEETRADKIGDFILDTFLFLTVASAVSGAATAIFISVFSREDSSESECSIKSLLNRNNKV